jgi:hypothetical protein
VRSSQTTTTNTTQSSSTIKHSGWGKPTDIVSIDEKNSKYSSSLKSVTLNSDSYGSSSTYSESSSSSTFNAFKVKNTTSKGFSLPMTVSRNSNPIDFPIIAEIGVIIGMIAAITGIIRTIINNAPEIGWSFKLNLEILAGDALLNWGWREHTDHRCYHHVAVGFELTVFSIKATLAIGANMSGVGMQVCTDLEGSLGYKYLAELTAPSPDPAADKAETSLGEVAGSITARTYAVIIFGNIGYAESGVKTSLDLTLKSKLNKEKKYEANINLEWSGIELTVEIKVGSGKIKPFNVKLSEPRNLFETTFPGPKKDESNENFNEDTIWESFKEAFTKGLNVKVQKETSEVYIIDPFFVEPFEYTKITKTNIDIDAVIWLLVDKVWSRRDELDLDKKTLEGIAYGVRRDLTEDGRIVSWDKFQAYADGENFVKLLDSAKSPAKAYEKQLKQLI